MLATLIMMTALASNGSVIEGVASVIDGDTLDIHGQRIRLEAIDAPESSQTCLVQGSTVPCGRRVAQTLDANIGGRVVRCQVHDHDRYGRSIATCFWQGRNINQWLVQQGLAVAYRHYSMAYAADEDAARAQHRGLWAGTFVWPWDYRAQHRGGTGTTVPTVLAPYTGTVPSGGFASCRQARAAGAAPLRRGQAGYRAALDRDGDGVACE